MLLLAKEACSRITARCIKRDDCWERDECEARACSRERSSPVSHRTGRTERLEETQGTGNSYNKIHFARNRQAPVSMITGGTTSPWTNDTFVTCAGTHDDGTIIECSD